jgi:hypothetical protein
MLDDLNQIDQEDREKSLVIAEVMLEEAISILRPKFFNVKEIDLTISYDPSHLSPVVVVQEDLRNVFDNLLENAFDAVTFGGSVRIVVSRQGPNCIISIEDNGCGIPTDVVPKLFAKGATFAKIGGTGLGLYQARRIAVESEGSIEYIALAQGSQFKVILPITQVGVAFVGLPKSEKVAVIDDDLLVVESLRMAGYELDAVASSYSEGKALLGKYLEPGMPILVDQRLGPDELGTDLILECGLRAEMVLCTNDFSDLDVIRRAKQIGLKILPKPFCFLAESPLRRSHSSLAKV